MRALFLCLLALPAFAAEPFRPDSATVERFGPAYRYPQHGWIIVHIEGTPYERGFQHGKLLSREIGDYLVNVAQQQSKGGREDAWGIIRTMVNALFLRKYDKEFLEEMQGIADGASAGGAKFDKRPVDLVDIVCLNAQLEFETLDNAIDATPNGLEGMRFKRPEKKDLPPPMERCSAFAATGAATKDGKMVIGHITMSGLGNALMSNVWLDIQPKMGHRVGMQGFPGAIWSAQDYYQNSAGLVLTETTIHQTQFNGEGVPLANRCRRAMQYGNSIDDVVKILLEKNNGLYTNEWLIGDANTNEIAMLELGTNAHKLWRSSKNEWLVPGTEGFYWGCNNAKDLKVRMDALPGLRGRPQDLTWVPSDRDKTWLKLFDKHRGKVDADFGKLAFATPPLAAIHSLDAKITTGDLAKKLESHILFGPPSHRVWEMTNYERERYTEPRSLVPNDWTVVTTATPKETKTDVAVDFGDKLPTRMDDPPTKPAWHGTLLPKTDDDVWLTAGFAAYERIVALENALKERSGGKLKKKDQERIELELFRYRAECLAAKAHEPHWRLPSVSRAPSKEKLELDRDRWHAVQIGLGIQYLEKARRELGLEKFTLTMDEFGRNHAGEAVVIQDFINAVGGFNFGEAEVEISSARPVDVRGWQHDAENTIIVYGTGADVAGNKAAAQELDKALRVKWWNGDLAILADKDATEEKLKGKHVLLIGRPAVNAVTKKFEKAFPVQFGDASATVNGKLYAHQRTAIVVGGVNPADPRYSVVAIAGFSADATYCAAQALPTAPGGEVLVFPRGNAAVPMVAKRETKPVAKP